MRPNISYDLDFDSGSREDGGPLNAQFDVFSDPNCSNSSLLETLWDEGSHLTRIKDMYDLRSRIFSMKSVRARYGMADDRLGDPTSVAGWNNTAVICPNEDTFICNGRDSTPYGSTIKRDFATFAPGYPPMVGQFATNDCSGPMSEDNSTAHPVNGRVTQAVPTINGGGDCIAWYPILDEQHGPSVGVQFGQEERVQQVDFFKSNPGCEADEKSSSLEGDIAAPSCCDKSAGGFLGTMGAGAIPIDFGTTRIVTLEAFALHLHPSSALPAIEHQSSSLDPFNLDLDLPFIGQSDPESPTFPLLNVDPTTAKAHPSLPPAVKLVNNVCTPYQPIFNSSKATLQLSTGLKAYNSSNDSMGTMQFDIFSSANCSNGTLIQTVWPTGDTIFTRITKEQEPRMYLMKSVRVRTMGGEKGGAMPTSWNETAILCHDEKLPCVKRDETTRGSHIAHKRHGMSGWMAHKRQHKQRDSSSRIAQYSTTDCSKKPITHYHSIDDEFLTAKPHQGLCSAYQPILNQTEGPSLGINFGSASDKIDELQIFIDNGKCDFDQGSYGIAVPESCCDALFGGLLGTIYRNGTSDFGADINLGKNNEACVWVTRTMMTPNPVSTSQYNVFNCSSGLITDKRVWPKVSGAGLVHNTKIEPRRYIYPHSPDTEQCVPWYPVVDQQHGRSVGISFGTNNESISQLQVFKESPECTAAYNGKTKERWSLTPWECCDGSNGLLGVINANGTSNAFGVRKGLGSNPGACVNIGKDGNEAFWRMRYMKAIV
ncbi:MAG: hypothetical protein OHK93_003766 [Ramalina farinacea]|uniref:Uncharacterized protein n=1 Tax=Ramalina farinacea TaxID=258253 RepID=A0AA43QU69_9LECA|nr:hypothetical protein [Ramalina farinacea]